MCLRERARVYHVRACIYTGTYVRACVLEQVDEYVESWPPRTQEEEEEDEAEEQWRRGNMEW